MIIKIKEWTNWLHLCHSSSRNLCHYCGSILLRTWYERWDLPDIKHTIEIGSTIIWSKYLCRLTWRHIRVQVWATSPILKPDLFVKWETLILTIVPCCPHCLLTVPGMKLKASILMPGPSCMWDIPTYGRLTWLVEDTLRDLILLCSFWITSWCSWSLDCRLLNSSAYSSFDFFLPTALDIKKFLMPVLHLSFCSFNNCWSFFD